MQVQDKYCLLIWCRYIQINAPAHLRSRTVPVFFILHKYAFGLDTGFMSLTDFSLPWLLINKNIIFIIYRLSL